MRFAFLLTTTALVASNAMAQDEVGQALQLPTVFLESAFRDERSILDTPISATVIGSEELQSKQADTIEELIGDTPGVTISGGPRGIAQELNVRGFQDEQVILRVDGGRFNFNRAHSGRFFFDPDSIKQVEVVRGGGSTLFGSGAIGGVVSFETIDAADLLKDGQKVGGRIKVGHSTNGSINNRNLTFAGDFGAVDALIFLGDRDIGEDFEDGAVNDIVATQVDAFNGLFKLGFEPTNEHRLEFSYSFYGDSGDVPAAADTEATATNIADRRSENEGFRFSWDYNPASTSLVDLSFLFYADSVDVDDDRFSDGRVDRTSFDTIGFELVNRSDLDAFVPVTFVYGIEYLKDEQTGSRDGADRTQFPDSEQETFSIFAEGTWALTQQLDLVTGIRYDVYDRDVDDPTLADTTSDFFSPRIGLNYRPNENWQIYGNVARAFRAPTLTELYVTGVHFPIFSPPLPFPIGFNNFIPNPDLEEERSTQFDIGTRYAGSNVFQAGDELSFAASIFYADVEDYIDFVVVNTFVSPFSAFGTSTNRNIDAEFYGIEASIDYDAGTWFAGAGITVTEADASDGVEIGTEPQDRLNLTFGIRPAPGVTLGLRATFAGDQSVPPGGIPGESYDLVDFFASYAPDSGLLKDAVFRFGVDNVLDENYTIFPNDLPQPGRTVKVSVGYTF
ncbi:MAG: TonB-dependent hemoglobin/transferrin/lactoferrin family receptor [Pseudomonadota bacterium]